MTDSKILIAEDNPIISLMMQAELEDAGFSVAGPFSSLKRALKAVEKTDIGLALIDIDLDAPRAGISLARNLSEKHDVPVVFVTGQVETARQAADVALGALSKPFGDDDVVRAARAAFDYCRRDVSPPDFNNIEWFIREEDHDRLAGQNISSQLSRR